MNLDKEMPLTWMSSLDDSKKKKKAQANRQTQNKTELSVPPNDSHPQIVL